MAPTCAGCKKHIRSIENLICSLCKDKYDLLCANITKDCYTAMTIEQIKSWKCQACRCKTPKISNLETPIHQLDYSTPQQNKTTNNNITTRKKTSSSTINTTLDDLSILGDTPHPEETINKQEAISLQNLSEIIMLRLKENNTHFILDIQNTIQIEINKAIAKLKEDIDGKTDFLHKQNEQKTQEIEKINKKIEELHNENETLKNEIKSLKALPLYSEKQQQNNIIDDNSKKIVIFGFYEDYRESEYELNNRLIDMFYEILHIDLTGYIEEIYRIGRKNSRNRPLVIELLSKRMAKFITGNSHYFKGTRIHVSEYLNENQQKERKLLLEKMINARKNGQYAILRNNVLFIDGKQITTKEEISSKTIIQQNNNSNITAVEVKKNEEIKHTTHKNHQQNYYQDRLNNTFRNY